jgi:catechol 2,3-dioxygenase-like lactoylglutathione lyase family enzyme
MKQIFLAAVGLALSACATAPQPEQVPPSPSSVEIEQEVTVKGLRAVIVSVSDIDRTLAFYGDAVDFEVVNRYQLDGDHFDQRLLNQSTDRIDVALVRLPNTYLKLLDFAPDQDELGQPQPLTGPGYTHICFKSPATGSAFDKFDSAGLTAVSRGGTPIDLLGAGTEYFYGRDLDGAMIEIEIDQRPRRDDAYWIGHVANVTPDIDRMVSFYETLIGYPVRRRAALSGSARADEIADIDSVSMKGAWFALNNIELEFWQFEAPVTPARAKPGTLDRIGYAGIAFEVTNLANEMKRLQNHGVTFIGEPKMEAGWRSVFAYDPDGTLFALEQNISAPQAESIDDMIWIDPETF